MVEHKPHASHRQLDSLSGLAPKVDGLLCNSPGTPKLAFSVEEAGRQIGVGRTSIFELIRSGRLEALKFGRRTLIPADALRTLLGQLPKVR